MKTNTNTKKLAVTVTLFIILSFNLAFAETFEKIIVPKHNNGVNINSEDQVVIFAGEKESVVIKNGIVVKNLGPFIPILPTISLEKGEFYYSVNFYRDTVMNCYDAFFELKRVVEKEDHLEISSLNPLGKTDFIEVKEIRETIHPKASIIHLKNFQEAEELYLKINSMVSKKLTKKGWEKH